MSLRLSSAAWQRRTASPVRPSELLRWRLSALGQGLSSAGAAGSVRQQRDLVGDLRSRQARPRRIAVLGSGGGVGTTTLAVLLASVLSVARDEQALLVSARSDPFDAATRLGMAQAPSLTAVLAGLVRQGQIPPTPVTRTGLRVLSAPAPGVRHDESEVGALLDAAAHGHPSTVIDLGTASQSGNLSALAACFDTALVVAGTTAASVDSADAVVARLRSELAPDAVVRVIVVRSQSRGRDCRGGTDLSGRRPRRATTTRVLPHDAELASGRPIELARLSEASLGVALSLAADIMGHR